jgi:hypothetical protein
MSGPPEVELWRERLLSRYGDATTADRVGFVLARSCNENAVAWISVRAVRVRLVAIWPELLERPRRGRAASGISYDRLKRSLAAHPDWVTVAQARYPDRRLGPAIRVLRQSVRREIGHPVGFAAAAKRHTEMTPGEAAWLSRFPKPKWHDTSNPKIKSQRKRPRKRGYPLVPAAPDVPAHLDQLPGWLPLHAEWAT